MSDDCYRKLNDGAYKYNRLSPIAVGDSHFTFYGDYQGMQVPQRLQVPALKLLTYSYVPPFLFPERQPPDYPHVVLI